MSNPHQQRTLLDEIDQRQNEVIDQLDDLNHQIESLLKECLGDRRGGGNVLEVVAE